MVDLSPYTAQAKYYLTPASFEPYGDPRELYKTELERIGFEPPAIIDIGKIQRLRAPMDTGRKRSGWSFYNEVPDSQSEGKVIGIGVFGSWKGAPEKVTWVSRNQEGMSSEERNHYFAQLEIAKGAREVEERFRNIEAAQEAITIWDNALPCPADHPYLKAKGIAPLGVKLSRQSIAVPVLVDNGEISSMQFILPDGTKKFLTGGKTKGGYFIIEGDDATVYIVEGYATGASVHMATGNKVYCAFSANNLYEVASRAKKNNSNSTIVIAADDDVYSEGNAGRTKATQAAGGLGIGLAFPCFSTPEAGLTDFNDLHTKEGIEAVKKCLIKEVKEAYKDSKPLPKHLMPPKGVLSDIYDFYNSTSGNIQYGFAVQTALAIGSIVCARSYKTNKDNFSALYFLNVGLSSTGKEHSKTVIEQILAACNMDNVIAGDGYTSAGAVFSTLLDKPRHISVIDEFGRYLEAGSSSKVGNTHQREANTKLMEAISRTHGSMRPASYSTMTLKKESADGLRNKKIHNPSITLMTMTTPVTLFKTLDLGAIKDGFVNRFIISISDAERAIRQHKDPLPVPDCIKEWVTTIEARAGNKHNPAEPPKFTVLDFSVDAMDAQVEFQRYCIDMANQLDKFGMAELTGRANELAMKVSLICALSRDPQANFILLEDIQWAINYVKSCLDDTINRLKLTVSGSDFESHKKEILRAIRGASPEWVKYSAMNKMQPYSQHQPKYLKDILQALVDSELIDEQMSSSGSKGGRPTKEYRAIK